MTPAGGTLGRPGREPGAYPIWEMTGAHGLPILGAPSASGHSKVEAILDLVFQLCRAAQDTPLADFQDVALSMLKRVVPFRAAVWLTAQLDRKDINFLRIHLHGMPPEALEPFVARSRQSPQPFVIAAQAPRRAHVFIASDLYTGVHDRDTLAFARRHGQERQLLIADLSAPSSPGEWLSLYRPAAQAPFDERERRNMTVLMPHLSEALAINRALSCETNSAPNVGVPAGDRALAPGEGPLADRLSPRELDIVRRFGAGASCKEIARRIALSPATVRNVVQSAYRKLGINNKVQLAQLVWKSG